LAGITRDCRFYRGALPEAEPRRLVVKLHSNPLVVLAQELEVRLGMVASRAPFRGGGAFIDITAVAAFPF